MQRVDYSLSSEDFMQAEFHGNQKLNYLRTMRNKSNKPVIKDPFEEEVK
jgi:hypothetical protein